MHMLLVPVAHPHLSPVFHVLCEVMHEDVIRDTCSTTAGRPPSTAIAHITHMYRSNRGLLSCCCHHTTLLPLLLVLPSRFQGRTRFSITPPP